MSLVTTVKPLPPAASYRAIKNKLLPRPWHPSHDDYPVETDIKSVRFTDINFNLPVELERYHSLKQRIKELTSYENLFFKNKRKLATLYGPKNNRNILPMPNFTDKTKIRHEAARLLETMDNLLTKNQIETEKNFLGIDYKLPNYDDCPF